jgi:hypothetical protein
MRCSQGDIIQYILPGRFANLFCSAASPKQGAGNNKQCCSHICFNGLSNVSHLSKGLTEYLQSLDQVTRFATAPK